MAEPVVALQMYTVREAAKQDYAAALKRVAEIGYPAVQPCWPTGHDAADVRRMLDDLQLRAAGLHIGLDWVETKTEETAEIVQALGCGYAVVPHLPQDRRETADQWKATAELFTRLAATLKESGVGFAYHNHAFEFETFDGTYGLDFLYGNADLGLVQTEIDTYWVQYGGADPVAYLNRYAGHIQLVHLKDMGKGEDRPMVPVGEGILDWPAIIEACRAGGSEYLIVEQDHCGELDPFEASRMSLENCRAWGLV